MSNPTLSPPGGKSSAPIAPIVERNIGIIRKMREKEEAKKSPHDRLAEGITNISGTMAFVYGNAVFFAVWLLLNSGWMGKGFDPFPFGMLTTIVSLEAIFLSLFVLITQNRMQVTSAREADLDLQINLLSEYENTKMLLILDEMAKKMDIQIPSDLTDLEEDTEPAEVMNQILNYGQPTGQTKETTPA
jgi:uncharacterized membrane protein